MVKETEIAAHINGVNYETSFEDGGTRIVVKKTQNVQPIIDANTRQRNDFNGTHGREFVKAASIPNIQVEKLMKKGIWQDPARLKAWLNDPDNRAFRTSTGKV
jgi:hypothetical protein